MAFLIGEHLGPYAILTQLGAGGMGEVYRARDTRLDRDVAIKVLAPRLSNSAEFRERFQREARSISQLAHPHICTLHDVGHHQGTDYLVMELLEGETLARRLGRGPLALELVLSYGVEMAAALSAAHRKGVVHRDLKPGNVMLTKAGAKLLDFGLAKSGALPDKTSTELTLTQPLTTHGAILGTFQYMAPEQLEGKEADERTDIFACGAVLYEMATGQRAFEGGSRASLIAAIMSAQPRPLRELLPMSPPALERLIRKCLAKDPEERWQSAADLTDELRWIAGGAGQSGAAAATRANARRFPALACTAAGALVLGTLIGLVALRSQVPPADRAVVRFAIEFTDPGGPRLGSDTEGLALELDRAGSTLVFTALHANQRRLYLRPLERAEARALPGTENGRDPFFSPDGRWVGFVSDGKLMKVPAAGGSPLTICEAAASSAAWHDDGTILFVEGNGSVLRRVDGAGGTPQTLALSDRDQRVAGRAQLVVGFNNVRTVPGAAYVLAGVWDGVTMEDYDAVRVSLDDGAVEQVIANATEPRYVAPDRLVFLREQSLFAAPFDARRGVVTGEAEPVLDGVLSNMWADSGRWAVSSSGTLAYVPGGRRGPGRRLVRVDASGRSEPLMDQPESVVGGVRASPDGAKVAITTMRRKLDLWTFDLNQSALTLVHNVGEIYSPVWTPDGSALLFQALTSDASPRILRRAADGSGQAHTVLELDAGDLTPTSMAPGGAVLLLDDENSAPRSKDDIVMLELGKQAAPQPVVASSASESDAQFSPDGKWFAYESNETGQFQIYVREFPDTGRRWQVSSSGGHSPRWAHSGRALFFLDGQAMYRTRVDTAGSFVAEPPEKLFDLAGTATTDVWGIYDVLPDERLIMVQPADWELRPLKIQVVVNWASELSGGE